MKDYILKGSVYEITLENDKIVKVSSKWVENTIKALDTDLEDVLLMWLEDNDHIINEELEELDTKAKANKIKLTAKASTTPKKTPKERTQKTQPEKEYIINSIYALLNNDNDISNLVVENKAKLITFDYKGASYKIDLVQKRPPKVKSE